MLGGHDGNKNDRKNNIFDRKQSKENEGYIDNKHNIFYRKQQKEDKDYIEKENNDSHDK